MNLLIVIAAVAVAALSAHYVAGKAKHWLNERNVYGTHATFLAASMTMTIPVVILIFGHYLIPAGLTVWPAIASVFFAVRTANRQWDGMDPSARRREILSRFGIC